MFIWKFPHRWMYVDVLGRIFSESFLSCFFESFRRLNPIFFGHLLTRFFKFSYSSLYHNKLHTIALIIKVVPPTINIRSNRRNASFGGSSLSLDNTSTDDTILATTTEDSSSAGPVFTLKRNSTSPSDADYLGQIKFKGENDADQEVVYAKITAKIQDATDGTEDGLIEFANKKAGSNVITARLRSDSLQLLNDSNLTVDGQISASSLISNNFSGSFQGDGSSLTGVTAAGTLSSSAQIATNISGSFTAASASISTRLTTEETNVDNLQSFSSSIFDDFTRKQA